MNDTLATELSYAMRNTEARQHFLSFNAPHELLDWSFLAIEALMIVGALLALIHACRSSQQSGSPSALYTFMGIFLFGLVMDIASYYTLVSFWHGEFSVMLVWNRLPLYIALLYPALLYHSYMTMRRFGFAPVTEAICTGFFSGTLYMIFDNLGPSLNWWTWNREVIYNQPFLNTVPLTSYAWMFLFSGALAYGLRLFAWDAVAAGNLRKARIGVACMPLFTIGLGMLLFLPYDLFLFVFENTLPISVLIHVVSFFFAAYWFVLHYRRPAPPRDGLLMCFPLLWVAALLCLFIAKQPVLAEVNLWVVMAALIISAVIILLSHSKTSPQPLLSIPHPGPLHKQGEGTTEDKSMNADNTRILIARYYAAFNAGNMAEFLSLLTNDVVHDINQGHRDVGIEAFGRFMERMNRNYQEQLHEVVVMASRDGSRGAAEFVVHGVYKNSDEGLPPAKGQTYVLPAGAFFEIREGKVARVTNYYNLQDWIRQVS